MKRLVFIISLILLLLTTTAYAQEAEQIDQLNFIIKANADASINITEQIAYDFGTTQHHGIFRNIPYKYSRNGYNYNTKISDVSVSDESGNPVKFKTSKKGSNFEIKIGDADFFVTGLKKYIIQYKVDRAINYFDDHDEIYWNAIGSEWTVPIVSGTGVLVLPQTDMHNVQILCIYGPVGSTNSCNGSTALENYQHFPSYMNPDETGLVINFQQSNIKPGEAITIVASVPKGLIRQPSKWEVLFNTIQDNLIFLLPLLVLLVMWQIWKKYGRDPKPSIPVVAQYEAPHNLTPVEVGYLFDERIQNHDISAEIIFLATKGYLKIERIPKKGLFSKEDFKLIKLKSADDSLSEFEKNLMSVIFYENEVLLSALKSKTTIQKHNFKTRIIIDKLTKEEYFTKNPNRIRAEYIVSGIVLFFALIVVVAKFLNISAIISVIISFFVFFVFAWLMPRKTQKGSDSKQMIKGLKLYLSVAEKDRLDFHNDPRIRKFLKSYCHLH